MSSACCNPTHYLGAIGWDTCYALPRLLIATSLKPHLVGGDLRDAMPDKHNGSLRLVPAHIAFLRISVRSPGNRHLLPELLIPNAPDASDLRRLLHLRTPDCYVLRVVTASGGAGFVRG